MACQSQAMWFCLVEEEVSRASGGRGVNQCLAVTIKQHRHFGPRAARTARNSTSKIIPGREIKSVLRRIRHLVFVLSRTGRIIHQESPPGTAEFCRDCPIVAASGDGQLVNFPAKCQITASPGVGAGRRPRFFAAKRLSRPGNRVHGPESPYVRRSGCAPERASC